MARARNLKPSFFKDAKIVACSFPARLLFQGLWCLADYAGRLKYIPIELKMEIFPADSVDVESCIEELKNVGLIDIYHDCSGAALVQVRNFSKHQNPHINERIGKDKKPLPCLPAPEEVAEASKKLPPKKDDIEQRVKDALVVLQEYSESNPADSPFLIPDSLISAPLNYCSELDSSKPDDVVNPIFIRIATNKFSSVGEEAQIREQQISDWQDAYPSVDVRRVLAQIRSWAINNPKKRKTLGGMNRFVDSWLAREQNSGRISYAANQQHRVAGSGSSKLSPADLVRSQARQALERIDREAGDSGVYPNGGPVWPQGH